MWLIWGGEWVSVVHVDGEDLVRVSWVSTQDVEGTSVFAGNDEVEVAL